MALLSKLIFFQRVKCKVAVFIEAVFMRGLLSLDKNNKLFLSYGKIYSILYLYAIEQIIVNSRIIF